MQWKQAPFLRLTTFINRQEKTKRIFRVSLNTFQDSVLLIAISDLPLVTDNEGEKANGIFFSLLALTIWKPFINCTWEMCISFCLIDNSTNCKMSNFWINIISLSYEVIFYNSTSKTCIQKMKTSVIVSIFLQIHMDKN